ncbi:hypothetical protein, partial [Dermatophilus congolensis]|uniref:hypothetical protein n=2 Tax=Dermatophilus congolensis TaxID=1863 RepID=UPI001AB05F3B
VLPCFEVVSWWGVAAVVNVMGSPGGVRWGLGWSGLQDWSPLYGSNLSVWQQIQLNLSLFTSFGGSDVFP